MSANNDGFSFEKFIQLLPSLANQQTFQDTLESNAHHVELIDAMLEALAESGTPGPTPNVTFSELRDAVALLRTAALQKHSRRKYSWPEPILAAGWKSSSLPKKRKIEPCAFQSRDPFLIPLMLSDSSTWPACCTTRSGRPCCFRMHQAVPTMTPRLFTI
jgi:hypothetical protein